MTMHSATRRRLRLRGVRYTVLRHHSCSLPTFRGFTMMSRSAALEFSVLVMLLLASRPSSALEYTTTDLSVVTGVQLSRATRVTQSGYVVASLWRSDTAVLIKESQVLTRLAPVGGNGVLRKHPSLGFQYDPYSLARMIEAGLGSLRFGDVSANTYYWRFGVGPQQNRPIETSAYDQPSKHSYGIEEHLGLCALVGAEPVIVVPLRPKPNSTLSESAQAAANLVRYCNEEAGTGTGWAPTTITGSEQIGWTETAVPSVSWAITASDAPAGYFGWLREHFSQHGPYGVQYFEIGNQPFLNGHNGSEYVSLLASFRGAMIAADSSIELLASIPTSREGYGTFADAVLPASGYSYLAPHFYIDPAAPVSSGQTPTQTDYDVLFGAAANTVPDELEAFGWPVTPVWPTEINTHYGLWEEGAVLADGVHNTRLKSALACGVEQLVLAAHDAKGSNIHHGPLVSEGTGENFNDTFRMITVDRVNEIPVDPQYPNGAKVLTERRWVAPHFYVQKLLNHLARATADETQVRSNSRLFAQSFRDEDRVRLFIVNFDAEDAQTARVYLGDGVIPSGPTVVYQLTGSNGMESTNECSGGVQVRDPAVTFTIITSNLFNLSAPAASLTVYDIALDDGAQILGVWADSVTGAPVRGAAVAEPGTGPTLATTDDFGVFFISGLSAGEHTLVVRDSRYVVQPANLTAGTTPVTAALVAVPTLSGTVKRPAVPPETQSQPVPGAAVWAAEPGNTVPLFSTVTDCEGNFSLPVPGGVYDVWAGRPGSQDRRSYSNAYVVDAAVCVSFVIGDGGSALLCQ